MLILFGTVVALLAVRPLGGRLGRLADLRLKQSWLICLALGLQVLAISIVPTWPRPPLVAMHVLSYFLAAAFAWRNRRLPGLPVLALGGFLNALAIGLNGGTLPASPSALRRAGLPVAQDKFLNSGALAHPRLAFLGDNYPSPAWFPLHNVYSIGDLLILCGACWMIHRACGTVLATDPRPALRRYRAATTVRMATHLDVLELLDDARRERDEALTALSRTGVRNDELSRELTRLRQDSHSRGRQGNDWPQQSAAPPLEQRMLRSI